ncbi:uncharacterized protein [Amphiura filiformis]|uniref:uncharacterized protein n=1 Tax=Amphiura filiformis TaxID=82378 RepID=UPI003B21EEE4
MAEEQTNLNQTELQDAVTEQIPEQNPEDDQTKDTENNLNERSAAENYNEIASKIFESSGEMSEEAKTDEVSDVKSSNKADVKTEETMIRNGNKGEDDVQKVKTDDQTVPDEPSQEVEDQQAGTESAVNLTPPAVKIEQAQSEDVGVSENDVQDKNEQIEQAVDNPDIITSTETEHIESNSQPIESSPAADDKQVNAVPVGDVVSAAAVDSNTTADTVDNVVDSNVKLTEDEIIQKLQEVNQQVYNDEDDKTAPGNEQSDTTLNPPDSSKNVRTDDLKDAPNTHETGESDAKDADAGDAQDASIIGAGGDANIAPTNELVENDDEGIENMTESTDNHNTEPTGPMSEIMSEDLDAMPVSDLYQNYTGKDEQEAAISENEAAISDVEQQQGTSHHVTYADLPSPNGALSNSSQVSLTKRSHGHVAHQSRGNTRPPPQTAPSRLSMHSTTKSVHIPQIPSPPGSNKGGRTVDDRRLATRNSHKLPPSLMRMSTVMVSARKRAILNRQASVYFEEKQTSKVVTLDQCINSRPPLPFDLDGPGPCHYSPRNKPLYETNAPEYSMGCKFYERDGGGRTAWAKSWFNSPDNFTRKVRWEKRWPSPNNYSSRSPILGRPQASVKSYPSFSIGIRSDFSINKRGSEIEPAPCQYNREKADHLVMRSAPSFSMAHRHEKTTLGKIIESTPSPTAYRPAFKHMSSHVHYPSFTIRGVRKQKIHALGPHSTL